MISLPSCFGGLDIINPCATFQFGYYGKWFLSIIPLEQDPVSVLNGKLALKQEAHLGNHRRCGKMADTLHLCYFLRYNVQRICLFERGL